MRSTAYDFKKAYKDLYMPATKPAFIDVPPMTFIAVAGHGDPNQGEGSYARALNVLYALSFTIKMSKMGSWQPEGYFDYVVPPLEGLWWLPGDAAPFTGEGIRDKSQLSWVSLIRQPDFVTADVFAWACESAAKKKPELADDLSMARRAVFAEGPCVQVLHKGPYDNEPATIAQIETFLAEQGVAEDIGLSGALGPQEVLATLDVNGAVPPLRLHHEIYLGDPRKTKPENLKTVIRHPITRIP